MTSAKKPDDNTQLIKDLVLMLAELTSWEEKDFHTHKAWRSYDWDALDALEEEGMVSFGRRDKSMVVLPRGSVRAQRLLDEYRQARLVRGASSDDYPVKPDAYHLRLEFDFTELVCTRDIAVPMGFAMDDLHTLIQACFNWLNYHLYDFEYPFGERTACLTKPRKNRPGGLPEDRYFFPVDEVTIDDVLKITLQFTYNYDYGDGWSIRITYVDDCILDTPGVPECLDGEGIAPPEDVGGECGFVHLLETVQRHDSEAKELSAWAEEQGWERNFDLEIVNERMARFEEFRAHEE